MARAGELGEGLTAALRRNARGITASILALAVVAGAVLVAMAVHDRASRIKVAAYFANSTGVYVGDDVRILGVKAGSIDKIEPQPDRVKISFWYDGKYKLPADVKAVILSPQLVAERAIQLTPTYSGGSVLESGAVIPQDRTVVPMEWDDLRDQLKRVTELLRPDQPGGVSTLGAAINTAADNLRGQGTDIHDTVVKLSQALSALGDHSDDVWGTLGNLGTLFDALHDSSDLLKQLNRNLAQVSSMVANDPNEVGRAVKDFNAVLVDVRNFVAENRESIGTTSDKLASISVPVDESIDEIVQLLHSAPTPLVNLYNIYEPANGALTGVLTLNNFSNTIQFICGSIQAASRLNAEQASKLCVQYMAPIIKNRQYNFLPLGENLFLDPMARPNEVTYSENWMRPDFVPPAGPPEAGPPGPPLDAESVSASVPTEPSNGLPGMMTPPGGGS